MTDPEVYEKLQELFRLSQAKLRDTLGKYPDLDNDMPFEAFCDISWDCTPLSQMRGRLNNIREPGANFDQTGQEIMALRGSELLAKARELAAIDLAIEGRI